jgi:hypothetical protein
MKIFYFGELIADTKIETEINESYIKEQIDLLYESQEMTEIDLENDTYQSTMPIRQLALI